MLYTEYKKIIEEEFEKIMDKNILFWNLWNLNYPYSILEKYKNEYFQYYSVFNEMWKLCWEFNDCGKIDYEQFYNIFGKLYPFVFDDDNIINKKGIQDKFEFLDDFCLPEKSIKEINCCFETIYEGIKENIKYGSYAGSSPINTIDIILDNNGLGFLEKNMDNPIVKNEIEAQIKLIKELSTPQNYTYKDRNIYRELIE
jgi:hypothetical protein